MENLVMNQVHLFYPCLVMLLLSAVVLYLAYTGRKNAVASGEVSGAYFKTYDNGEKLPRKARQAERCFQNLMESAPPFYFLCAMTVALNQVDVFMVIIAWIYVACRIVQSSVHLTSNKIGMRSMCFMLSWFAMLVMALRLAYMAS